MQRSVRRVSWASLEETGAERLTLAETGAGYLAEGTLVGSGTGSSACGRYEIALSPTWQVTRVAAAWEQGGRRQSLSLQTESSGIWRSPAAPEPALTGCTDVDIAWTPFTNTLPIRRLGLSPGEGREIQVVYICPPYLRPEPVGFSFTAPYTARAEAGVLVPRLWMRLLSRVGEIRHCIDPSVRLGLSVHQPREFTYHITVQVSAVEAVPDDMVSLSVEGHRYARFTHTGSMERERVDATFLAAFAWIESQGLTRSREAPWVERYDHRYDPASPRNAFEILLPVD